jgi:tape measure domain-containing protein
VSVVANVAINVDARSALSQLRAVENATAKVAIGADRMVARMSGGIKQLGNGISGLGKQLASLSGTLASIGASAAVGGFVKAGIEADRTGKTIKALAGQYGETAKVTQIANDAAKSFGLGQTQASKAVADLYGRLRPMGITLDQIGATFNGVNKAARLMNLSAADTDGVMLQLSQAMGSGALQGDELRSVMERLPAIGQAIAKVMGVSVSEIKQLGSEGKLTTDIIVKAMDELNKIQAPPPDPFMRFQAAMADLQTTIGIQLLPLFSKLAESLNELVARMSELQVGQRIAKALTPLADVLFKLLNGFLKLPAPMQEAIIQAGVLVGAFALIAAPLGFLIQGIGALVSAIGTVIGAFKGMTILVSIVKVFASIASAALSLGKVLIAVFAGPVGWVALAVAAGVAIYAFRDRIAAAFEAIGRFVKQASQGFYDTFIEPVIKWNQMLYDGMIKLFSGLAVALRRPFEAVANMIRGVLNAIIGTMNRQIAAAVNAINRLIAGANNVARRLNLPQLPMMQAPQIPMLAEGGVVNKPTLAMIGEGGEPEYVVPQSKADAFARNWIAGRQSGGNGGAASVNITTGPVMQQDGQRYVTLGDLESAMQQVVGTVLNNGRTSGGRRYAGIR